MKNLIRLMTALALLMAAGGCDRAGAQLDTVAHEQEILEWRQWRREQLFLPGGYLNQVGLHWLGDGVYTIGSDSSSDIVLPASAALLVGTILVSGDEIRQVVVDGVEVLSDGEAVEDILMPPDVSGTFVMMSHGTIAWNAIERGGKLAIRVRDFEHPWLESFGELPYFDIDPASRVEATLHRYDEPRVITVNTVIEGFQQNPVAPGTATMEIAGVEYELEPQTVGDQLFFVFGDETNRDATYGAGRYLYAATPGDDGKFILDFNKSYSPPCAFNDFSTCPVASPRNRLPIRIEAGEKFDEILHYSGAAAH